MGVDRSQCTTVIINPKRVTVTAHFVNSDTDTNYDVNDISVTAIEIFDGENCVSVYNSLRKFVITLQIV